VCSVSAMSVVIELVPHDVRGFTILDELESETGHLPVKTHAQGARTYYLQNAGPDGFDATLERIAPDWRAHLARTQQEQGPGGDRLAA
jgi:hypothetical protein